MNTCITKNSSVKKHKSLIIISLIFISISISAIDNNSTIKRIVIDPGHGGQDPGALGSKSKEKDITLSIALKTAKYIQSNYKDVEVIFTRSEDVFIPLHERADIANKNHADLFISIHANANPNPHITGVETYAMGLHTNEKNLEVAMKENAVITLEKDYSAKYEGYDPNSAESFIIFSLLQNTNLDQSLTIASFIEDQFKAVNRTDRGVKQAGFLVLWKTSMPAILIEIGFISNPKEEAFLMSDEGQDQLAKSISNAFGNYKNIIESKSQFEITKQPDKQVTEDTINSESETTYDSILSSPTFKSTNENISFMVQIVSSSKALPKKSDFFNPVKKIKNAGNIKQIESNNTYKYLIGNKKDYNEIIDFSKEVKKQYPNAFIVAVKNGKIIPISEAVNK